MWCLNSNTLGQQPETTDPKLTSLSHLSDAHPCLDPIFNVSMWKPPDWKEPSDELGRYVFGVRGSDDEKEEDSSSGRSRESRHRERTDEDTRRAHGRASQGSEAMQRRTAREQPATEDSIQPHGSSAVQDRGVRKTSSKRVKCEVCDRTFFDKSTLNRHVAVVHEKKKNISCPNCGKRFAKNAIMQHHVAVRGTPTLYNPYLQIRRGEG